jgi:hypothetical protein
VKPEAINIPNLWEIIPVVLPDRSDKQTLLPAKKYSKYAHSVKQTVTL